MEKSINDKTFVDMLNHLSHNNEVKVSNYSSLSLALLGDAVYDLYIRYYVLSQGDDKINVLHGKKSYYVRAKSQAAFIDYYIENLTENELNIYKRGRNTKSKTVAKNATVIEYRKSTGFEALLGYLFLENKIDRLLEIIKESIVYNGRING